MLETILAIWQLFLEFLAVVVLILRLLAPLLPVALWCAWWLWCVNWKKAWPFLVSGGWIVIVLLVITSAMAWSAIFPSRGPWESAGLPLPNFWWQLGGTTALALLALFSGWVQGRLGWTPPEVVFDPPAHGGHDPHSAYHVGRSAPEVVFARTGHHEHGHHEGGHH